MFWSLGYDTLAKPVLIKRVERMNATVVNPNQWTELVLRHDPYAMEVNHRRNCYSYEEFGHLARNCRMRKET